MSGCSMITVKAIASCFSSFLCLPAVLARVPSADPAVLLAQKVTQSQGYKGRYEKYDALPEHAQLVQRAKIHGSWGADGKRILECILQGDSKKLLLTKDQSYNYRSRSEGDNVLGSVRLSVCLFVDLDLG